MLIDEIVKFCDEEYKGSSCTNCGTCGNEHLCERDCKECLDDLHFHKNKIRNAYDCEHLLDFYVCRYSYKYCSEMMYALETLDLSSYPRFNILSLGCGGAPDLMAFEYMNYRKEIFYCGIDKNIYWRKIHNKILEVSTMRDINFSRNIDVLDYFNTSCLDGYNVLIIEYLISFFYTQIGAQGVKKWFDKLVNNVIKYKLHGSPFLIIINDVDSIYTGRDSFVLLKDILQKEGFTIITEKKKRFKEHDYYTGSTIYPSHMNMFSIPANFIDEYKIAIRCESVQLILEVQ